MARQAKASTLLRGLNIIRIPNGLDTDAFKPRDRNAARDLFGLPQNRKVVMVVAHYLHNHRKGFDLLAASFDMLPADSPIVLASAGFLDEAAPFRQHHFPLGEIPSERLMSFALSAADLFVAPRGTIIFLMSCSKPWRAASQWSASTLAEWPMWSETGKLAFWSNRRTSRDYVTRSRRFCTTTNSGAACRAIAAKSP